MEASLSQKDKIAAAKKKLKRFQQKSARLEKNSNGSHEVDNESQVSQLSDTALHQQTIDILVEEKAELLRTRDKQNSNIQQLKDELSVLRSQLHSSNSDLSSSEKKKSTLQSQYNNALAESQEKQKENSKLQSQVSSLNDQLNVLQTEFSSLSLEREELNERLSNSAPPQPKIQNTMSSVPNPFKRNDDVIRLEEEVKKLTGELEGLRSGLLNKEMQCDVLAGKLSHQETVFKEQIQGLEVELQERDANMSTLQEEITALSVTPEPVLQPSPSAPETEITPESDSEQVTAVAQAPSTNIPVTDQSEKLLAEVTVEKQKLEMALEEQILQTLSLQKELDKFKETHVDQNSLLTQINNDKATISRAMGQNRQLKDHMLELQDKLMRTSETNASLANEVQELSSRVSCLMSELADSEERVEQLGEQGETLQRPLSEDSLLDGASSRAQVVELREQLKEFKKTISSLQQEKAILGLSAAQVDSVKAMNVALQEKVASLSKQLDTGKSPNEEALEEKIERLEKQYNSEAVDKKIQDMLTNERLEREKQREFLDKYYEEQLRDQIGTLEERITAQTRQFKHYITEIQTSHDDEVEALRGQLSELQQNFRSSLKTQYTQLVHYFTNKGASDLKAREEELHTHYMDELSRLYNEMNKQIQQETQEIRERKRTQSDELSVYTVDDREEVKDLEQEKQTLQSTLDQLEEELVKIETGLGEDTDEEEEEEEEGADVMTQETSRSKEERKLQAHVRVLEMQLSRAKMQQERSVQHYKQEIQRQSQVIQKLHMYLATQHYDNSHQDAALDNRRSSVTRYDSEGVVENGGDDSISITSAGQFERGDLSATKDMPTENKTKDTPGNQDVVPQNLNHQEVPLDVMKAHMQSTETEFENKLKYLASKGPHGDEYMQHMQKLQEKFAVVMKENANLVEKVKDIEHQNIILEGETDTIGEYISLYQSQRQALRLQFQQKDNLINKLLNERSDMQAHISRLQQLITELPCVDEAEDTLKTAPFGRSRSNSISSNVSTLSIMSTTRDEMLEIIGRLRLKTDIGKKPVTGPMYGGGGRGPIKDF
ncbi:golgin subfamily A member 2-like [Bolinopsis microptera]|uniref:golgin subfamily A member 2-like n=1 Tax=Bolinopsis microptera TaxID=2820187 RepID=UPI00307A3110